mgnify:CR=1 FL=1|jgi:hypothetical protein
MPTLYSAGVNYDRNDLVLIYKEHTVALIS